jgi:hypothetical protein
LKDIELGASGLKTVARSLIREATRIDSEIKKNGATKDFIKRMQYIIDNVDSMKVSVSFAYMDNQATPGCDGKGNRATTLYLFSMYNLMDESSRMPGGRTEMRFRAQGKAYNKGKDNKEKVLSLPLPGHMGMSEKDLEEFGLKRIIREMARNEENRIADKLPKPKVFKWDKDQIGALLANELMHCFDDERLGAYQAGGAPKKYDGIYLGDGKKVWDFMLSLNEDTWYSDITTANHIMQAIYYQRIFWEPLKPKK